LLYVFLPSHGDLLKTKRGWMRTNEISMQFTFYDSGIQFGGTFITLFTLLVAKRSSR
jgi:hypothetical protein